jgi:predicted helicase
LTNSLEEHHPDTGTLFASWLSSEANEASHVKRDTPVMVVLGNPPDSVSSSNKGEWIQTLIKDYKENLNEKKINLDDDYIKFLRYGQFLIEKNGEGILAFISNNSFIDGVTHRQMRKSLIESFDKIYIIDLHGSLKKKETDTEGGKDENVFDIQQGVSINIFVKTGKKPKYSRNSVYHSDVFGTRAFKYERLFNSSIDLTQFQSINYSKPYHFFVSKDFSLQSEYDNFISIADLFIEIGSGVKTERDRVCIHFSKKELIETINNFTDKSETDLRSLYKLGEDSRDWKLKSAIHDVRINLKKNLHIQYDYRPFDTRWTFYTDKAGAL